MDINGEFDETTLLIESVLQGREALVDLVLQHGADINQGSPNVVTPLCAAAATNHLCVAQLLLDRGCDITKLSDNRPAYTVATPLHYAILNNNPRMVKLLLDQGHDPNKPSHHHAYPIQEAIRLNRPAIIKLLLDNQTCEMNRASRIFGGWNFPPLHQSVFAYRRFDVAKLLLDSQRCDLTFSGGSYLSMMLMKAFDCTLYMHLKFIKLILEAGCDMVNKDRHGNTPFTTLIEGNDAIFEITRMQNLMVLLIRAGIYPSSQELSLLSKHIRNENEQKFYNWVNDVVLIPRTLQEQCRQRLRRYFGCYPNEHLKKLPLPQQLLGYVTLEYLQQLPELQIS